MSDWLDVVQELCELHGPADSINQGVFHALEQTMTDSPGCFNTKQSDSNNMQVFSHTNNEACVAVLLHHELRKLYASPENISPCMQSDNNRSENGDLPSSNGQQDTAKRVIVMSPHPDDDGKIPGTLCCCVE